MSDADTEGAPAGREEVWIEKYRPRRLDDIVGQDTITERLQSYVDRDDLSHMLFSGPAGVGKCVTGETPVLTGRGLSRIEDVVGAIDGFEANEDVEVLTLTESGEFEYAKPSHRFSKPGDELVTVRTRDGSEMTVTPEHRLLVVTNDGFDWKEATNLGDGDRIVRPLRAPLPESDNSTDWIQRMDGDRTFAHVTESFAREHGIPAELNHVGTKRSIVRALREEDSLDDAAAAADTTRKYVRAVEREIDEETFDDVSTICPLSYFRSLDASEDEVRHNVEAIQRISPTNNSRSTPVSPPSEVTPELARFVGLAISEARIEGTRIKFYNTNDRILGQFEDAVRSLFDIEPTLGTQQDVPYVEVNNGTVTQYLTACFDVFANATGQETTSLGSAILRADAASRKAFLRAVFDAEGHVTKYGVVELAQKDGGLVTLLSYLLAGFGIPSRRKRKQKAPTNGTGTEREYHALYVSSSSALSRFRDEVGFTIDSKRDRLDDAVAKSGNPNHDTAPVQDAVDTLCESLHLTKSDLVTETLHPETPGRENYEGDLERVLDVATAKVERTQQVLEEVEGLEPLETRREVTAETGISTGRLLEYADGRRVPYAARARRLVGFVGEAETLPGAQVIRQTLRDAVDTLGLPYERVADGTHMRGVDVQNLLEREGHEIRSLPRFATVASRIEELATGMLSSEVLQSLRTLDLLVESSLYFDEVTGVEPNECSERVYDLTVPGSRNYVAGSVPTVVHNTTAATAIARELYGESWEENFLELNASDERGIDVVRDRIKSFARTSFGGHDYRIIFLDEADALCVPPGTEVVTGSPSSPEVKKIEDVDEEGESVPSVDFETNEIQSDEGKLVDSGVADFFELELADGRTTLASLSHPFFVVGEDGKLVEKELQELEPGDEIADFKDEIGVSRCEVCGDYEVEPALITDGGLQTVETVAVRNIAFSHRGKAYNISMEDTPNFMLANGILTHNTSDAQSALRRTMEQFSNNVRFILSCNYSSQIIDPIQSRCAVFRFAPLSDEAVAEETRHIAEQEGIEVTDDGMDALVYAADGDMRKAINALQAASVTGGVVDEEAVYAITSTARPEEIREMVQQAIDGDFTAARSTLDRLLTEEGIAGGDVIDQTHRAVWEFDLEEEAAVRLLDRIGETEYRITRGANERIQLEALLASLALDD